MFIHLSKQSIVLLTFFWITTVFAGDYNTDIWCELQNNNECGECGILSDQELDGKAECALGKITPVSDDETTTNPPPVVVPPVDPPPPVITPKPTTIVTPSNDPATDMSVETPTTTPAATDSPVVNPSPVAEKPVTEVTATGDETDPPSTNTEKPNTSNPQSTVNTTEVTTPPPQTVVEEQPQNPSSLPIEEPSSEELQSSEKTSEIVIKPASIQFTQNAVTIDEFGHSSTILTVLVKRTVNCQETVSVKYEIRPETATFPEDYQASTGQVLTWPKGDCNSKVIKIAIKDDTQSEGDETFSIALLPPSEMAELGEIDTVQVTIKDDDTSECNITQSLQPAQYDLLLHKDDQPLILTFANAQSVPEIKQAPDPQVVTFELPMIYENNAIQLKIVPYGIGETTFVIGDCASQATIHIKVDLIQVKNCLQDNSLALKFSQPSVTLLENDLPVYLAVVGGQDRPRLTQAPKGEVVTLQSLTYLDYAAAGLTLVPRRAGKTEVTLADCASKATLEIQVLKTGTMAYYCWLDGKTTEICEKPDIQQRIAPNSFGIDTQGNSFSPLTRFEGKIFAYQQEGENLIVLSNETGVQVKWTVLIDPAHQNQQADLLMVAKRLTPENVIEWWMLDDDETTWQRWDGEDLAALTEITREFLPAILEKTVELDSLLSEDRNSGEFTLYFGYRLENGSLVFNGMKPPLMRIANNLRTSNRPTL